MSEDQSPDEAGAPHAAMDRGSIIRTIRTPLGFFALVVLVVDGALFSSAAFVDAGSRTELMRWAGASLLLALIIVGLLAAFRSDALSGRANHVDGMVHAIGTDICEAIRPYLNDIESEKTRREAYETLIALIGNPDDRANRKIRTELARVIRARLKALGDLRD